MSYYDKYDHVIVRQRTGGAVRTTARVKWTLPKRATRALSLYIYLERALLLILTLDLSHFNIVHLIISYMLLQSEPALYVLLIVIKLEVPLSSDTSFSTLHVRICRERQHQNYSLGLGKHPRHEGPVSETPM